jgi:hypothetical protein
MLFGMPGAGSVAARRVDVRGSIVVPGRRRERVWAVVLGCATPGSAPSCGSEGRGRILTG